MNNKKIFVNLEKIWYTLNRLMKKKILVLFLTLFLLVTFTFKTLPGVKSQTPTETYTAADEGKDYAKILIDFINLFLRGLGGESGGEEPLPTGFPGPTGPLPTIPNITPIISGNYVYYSQCEPPSVGNYPLPDGCTICKAGCGPTTVAMILSSFIDLIYNPPKMVNIYKNKAYYAGCDGTSYSDAQKVLQSYGMKTTSSLFWYPSGVKAEEVAQDMKNYIDGGWTVFALANFCDGGCGHFFWVVDVEQGQIFAFDSYYGRNKPKPLNENTFYPLPKYRAAFAVKRS